MKNIWKHDSYQGVMLNPEEAGLISKILLNLSPKRDFRSGLSVKEQQLAQRLGKELTK